jgi:hypothetical protein
MGASMILLPPREPRKRTETDVVYGILGALNAIRGVRAVRNNVGVLEDKRGIPVSFGLGEGSPDVVGAITFGGVESFLELVRHLEPIALTFAIEVKRPRDEGGRGATRDQQAWHATAIRRGILTNVSRTPAEACDFVLEAIATFKERIFALSRILQAAQPRPYR